VVLLLCTFFFKEFKAKKANLTLSQTKIKNKVFFLWKAIKGYSAASLLRKTSLESPCNFRGGLVGHPHRNPTNTSFFATWRNRHLCRKAFDYLCSRASGLGSIFGENCYSQGVFFYLARERPCTA
jgi:hypothetical protein